MLLPSPKIVSTLIFIQAHGRAINHVRAPLTSVRLSSAHLSTAQYHLDRMGNV